MQTGVSYHLKWPQEKAHAALDKIPATSMRVRVRCAIVPSRCVNKNNNANLQDWKEGKPLRVAPVLRLTSVQNDPVAEAQKAEKV